MKNKITVILAWQWFTQSDHCRDHGFEMPMKSDFVDRKVAEPYAVQLAGEHDIWDKRNPDAEIFQLGLRSVENLNWDRLLSFTGLSYIEKLIENGKLLQLYVNQRDSEIVGNIGFLTNFEGLKFLAMNSSTRGSLQFAALDIPLTGHDALLKFNWTGKCWDVSMYHAKHRPELDLSLIAAKYGGGHRGACGFRIQTLPDCILGVDTHH